MRPTGEYELPDDLKPMLRRAIVLEWITIAYMLSVVVALGLVMGSSQAMRTAWAEDILSLVPPIAFLISSRIRHKKPNDRFPLGYHRVVSIAFLFAALALLTLGLLLLIENAIKLIKAEHPSIGSVTWFGEPIWLGWLMLAVLGYSVVGPVILGHLKLKPARELHDKTLFADSQMNKADWMTGLAAGLGIVGIGLGWWWADAVAAMAISLSILHDGWRNTSAVLQDLMDRQPYKVDHTQPEELPERMRNALARMDWVEAADVRLREAGHVFFGEVYIVPRDERDLVARALRVRRELGDLDWRVHDLTVDFVPSLDDERM